MTSILPANPNLSIYVLMLKDGREDEHVSVKSYKIPEYLTFLSTISAVCCNATCQANSTLPSSNHKCGYITLVMRVGLFRGVRLSALDVFTDVHRGGPRTREPVFFAWNDCSLLPARLSVLKRTRTASFGQYLREEGETEGQRLATED